MGQVYPVLTQLAKYDSAVSGTRLDRSKNVDFKGHLPTKVVSPVEKTGEFAQYNLTTLVLDSVGRCRSVSPFLAFTISENDFQHQSSDWM